MKTGVTILNLEQGSNEWLSARAMLITASECHKAISGKTTATRATYMNEKIAFIATGEIGESFDNKAMEWGRAQEPVARAAYEFSKNVTVKEVGLVVSENKRCGASPDGIIEATNSGLEIKAPFNSKNHIEFLLMDKIKSEYIYQVQFSLWVTGLDAWDFASFDPRMKKNLLKYHAIEKDEKLFERFDNEIGEFILDMDKALSKLGLEF